MTNLNELPVIKKARQMCWQDISTAPQYPEIFLASNKESYGWQWELAVSPQGEESYTLQQDLGYTHWKLLDTPEDDTISKLLKVIEKQRKALNKISKMRIRDNQQDGVNYAKCIKTAQQAIAETDKILTTKGEK